jgi:gliding motility-associated-like protein
MPRFVNLLILFFLCAIVNTYAQSSYCPPVNIGFEDGTFNNWECDTGSISKAVVITVIPCPPVYNRHTIVSGTGTDEFGHFPQLCPYGGKYSIQLGNKEVGAQAERVSYNFTVPAGANQYDLVFYYAVVLQNPNHLPYQQPRFTVQTFDVTDNVYVDCASFDFIASSDLPGFKLAYSPNKADSDVYYKDWSPSTINLVGYAGKQMQLQFTTNDCSKGEHFGYAYVDVNENCGSLITGNDYCNTQTSVTLLAPGGFGSYAWYTADGSQLLGSNQSLTISPPPPDNTQYQVQLTPFYGLGCAGTLETTVHSVDAAYKFVVEDTVKACLGASADLTAASVTAGSSSNLTYTYFTDSQATQYLYLPNAVTKPGTYYIKAVSPQGCTSVLPVQVAIIDPPTLTITNPRAVTYPATVDLSTTFTPDPNLTYSYFFNNIATVPLPDYQHAAKTGTYYIEATNSIGCNTIRPVRVVVNPPGPQFVKAVNTFTPNNDGINDYFSVTMVGAAKFSSLKIYTRYGELVFQTSSPYIQWDGTYKGKPLNTGTYYWIVEGINGYNNTKFVQGGEIMLIR